MNQPHQDLETRRIVELWSWPFGIWRSAADAWLSAYAQLFGGSAARGGGLSPVEVDPWAALRAWMPQVEAVVEPLEQESGEEATRVRMRLQLPGWGGQIAGEILSVDAVVRRSMSEHPPILPQPAAASLMSAPASAEPPAAPARRRAPRRKPAVPASGAD